MIFARTLLALLMLTVAAQETHAASSGQQGSGQSGLCSYAPVTTPLNQGACWPVNVNGVTQTVTAQQFFKNAVQGPASSTIGDAVIFSNVGGTAIADAGAPPVLLNPNAPPLFQVADTVALQSLAISPFALSIKVRVGTYNLSNHQFSPPVDYFLTQTACTIDAGSCFAGATMGYYWHITPQTVWDARWWGAYEDITKVKAVTNTTNTSCNVNVSGASFVAGDVGKSITITHGDTSTSSSVNGTSYIGSITTVTDAADIVVSPCVGFTTSVTQHVTYGHDDATSWNAAFNYLNGAVIAGAGGQPVLSAGGRSTGFASAYINDNANVALENVEFVALGYSNLGFTCATTNRLCTLGSGVSTNVGFRINSSFGTSLNVIVDANYLPINACFTSANGTVFWNNLRCKNWHGSVNTVSIPAASTTTAATITGSLGGCVATPGGGGPFPYMCTLNVTAVGANPVQPGQTLVGAGVPDGTYISQFGADGVTGAGTGGFGQYTVINNTAALSTVSSEAMTTLGLDIAVSSCNQTTFAQLFNPIGLVYHNNVSFNGILDRTFIVGCANATTMVLNKPPVHAFSGQTLTFSQDSNGFLGIGNQGVQINNLTISQDDAAYFGNINNHYGCGQLVDGNGGSGFWHDSISYGAANVCVGPDAADNQWRLLVTVGVAAGGYIELNSPAFLAMDGAQNITISDANFGGQMQFFLLTAGSNTQTSILQNWPFTQGPQTNYAPNNTYWFYTEIANQSTNFLNLDIPYKNSNSPNPTTGLSGGSPYVVNFTAGRSGSWLQYTGAQIARLSRSMSPMIPANSGTGQSPAQPMQTLGLDLNTMPLTAAERCVAGGVPQAGAYTFVEADSNCTLYENGAGGGTATITLPPNIGQNTSAFFEGNWVAWIIVHSNVTLSLALGAGGTLYNAGAALGGPLTLTTNFKYEIECFANSGGSTPSCIVTKSN